ncbi:MAG: glycine cleavage system protein GcvH [Candidatus Competibacteraceae bacterium]|jgi:glycine cleavage system H protein|nr:glycine cleavage system protein GcvH [Candidatus Competibacteraceae bacterium]
MSTIPPELQYTSTHEWVRSNDDGTITVGVTDHAQALLGDMVFVELPELGRKVKAAEECAVVESVKSASDIYSPVTGTITGVNDALIDAPELINQDPYSEGWLFHLETDAALDSLLDAAAYTKLAAETE